MKELGTNGVARHQQLGRKLNSYIYDLEMRKENLEFELWAVLSRIRVDMSSTGVAIVAFADVASDEGLQLAGDASGCSLWIKSPKALPSEGFFISQFLSL